MNESGNAEADRFFSPEFWQKTIEKGVEEIQEMREKWQKAETKKRVQEIDNEFWFHKQFLEFKIWIKGVDPSKNYVRKAVNRLICLDQNFGVSMDKHHVNDTDVVFISTIVHRSVKHERGDGKLEGVVG